MREILYSALSTNSSLGDNYGLDEDHVFPNYAITKTPRDNPFLIIRYEEQDVVRPAIGRGAEIVTLWAHTPKELGTDMIVLRDILLGARDVMIGLIGTQDSNFRITDVRFTGYGGDLSDEGYDTFTKNAGFEILYHPVG